MTSSTPMVWESLKSWLDAGLAFFYPEVCQCCGKERATAAEGYVGRNCWKDVRFITPPFCDRCGLPYEGDLRLPFTCSNCRELELAFTRARSAVAAKGVVLDVLHRYKYSRALWFEPFLADLLVRIAAPVLRQESWDMITPVPLHWLKQSEREFNQSERLASHLAVASGLPFETRCVVRRSPTRTQALLARTERTENVRRAFAVSAPTVVHGRRVVLVDDVLTTGATASACATVLLQAGAKEVCVWTLARGLLHS